MERSSLAIFSGKFVGDLFGVVRRLVAAGNVAGILGSGFHECISHRLQRNRSGRQCVGRGKQGGNTAASEICVLYMVTFIPSFTQIVFPIWRYWV